MIVAELLHLVEVFTPPPSRQFASRNHLVIFLLLPMPCYQQVVGHAWSCIAATGYSVFVKEKQVYLAKSAPSENCSFCRSFSTACLSNNARLLENSSVSCFSVLLTVLSFALELTTIVLITTSTRFLLMACWSFLVHIDR